MPALRAHAGAARGACREGGGECAGATAGLGDVPGACSFLDRYPRQVARVRARRGCVQSMPPMPPPASGPSRQPAPGPLNPSSLHARARLPPALRPVVGPLLLPSRQYVAYYADVAPTIDGRPDEQLWADVGWSQPFVDIRGCPPPETAPLPSPALRLPPANPPAPCPAHCCPPVRARALRAARAPSCCLPRAPSTLPRDWAGRAQSTRVVRRSRACVCVRACACVCMCARVRVRACVCVQVRLQAPAPLPNAGQGPVGPTVSLHRRAPSSTYVCVYIHTYMRTYIHTCIHACIHTYIHTCIHTYIHTCIHAYIHAYIHPYIHACIHTHIHAYIHTYIHTSIHDGPYYRSPCLQFLTTECVPLLQNVFSYYRMCSLTTECVPYYTQEPEIWANMTDNQVIFKDNDFEARVP